jgi:hypothetical protein
MAQFYQDLERAFLIEPWQAAGGLSHLPEFFYLDSSRLENGREEDYSRFSIIAACPVSILRGNLFDDSDFGNLRELYETRRYPDGSSPEPGSPEAGLYGYVSYEGDFVFGEYDDVLVFDHVLGSWRESGCLSPLREPLPETRRSDAKIEFSSNLDRTSFCSLVERAQEYIAAGDIYQVNLAQRFDLPVTAPAWDLFESLLATSPAPFAASFDCGEFSLLSSSPELFLRLSGNHVITRPIKGTRPRGTDHGDDLTGGYGQVQRAERGTAGIVDPDVVQGRRSTRLCLSHGRADTGW